MNSKMIMLPFVLFIVLPVWMPAQAEVETRSVTFTPSDPVAGQQLLFTASRFRTPNLLKWDMGDGTVLISGGKISGDGKATLAYVYSAAGKYLVKVFDAGGDSNLPPVTAQVTVSARIQEKPLTTSEKPLPADHPKDPPREIIEKPIQADRPKDPPREIIEKPIQADRPKDLPQEIREKPRPAGPAAVSIPAAAAPVPARKKYPLIKIGPYAGYFRPQDMWVKKIYGEGDVIYGARVGVHVWKGFYFWLSAAQFKMIAETTFSKDRTALTLLPVSAFLRYRIRLGFVRPYAGIGFTYLSFKEESEIGNVTGSGNNAAYEGGFELKINRNFLLDLGARYDLIKVKPTGFEIDLGGVQAGISLLISF